MSWALFAFCFTLLLLGAITVMGLGGYCASGGAYVIETECPAAVVATMPLSIFGGLAAVAVGLLLARGFGMPLVAWAWPILFVGLGGAFLAVGVLAFAVGGLTFVIIGVLFVVMGLVPLVLGLRSAARELFLGTTNAADVPFVSASDARRRFVPARFRGTLPEEGRIDPGPGDWLASLFTAGASITLGIWLGNLLFTSF